ncbi:MAG: response regulator [Verrucomicrobia bacterium]|nr:response regulator [Verrucomicrobiota bacterium]
MILEKMLKDLGLETIEAESGADAIWFLGEDANIDLITVDYHMPKMTGVQFVRLLREKPEFKSTPVLMISMEARPEIRAQALAAGVNDFLEKPFTEEMIAEKLRSLGIEPSGTSNPPDAGA